MSITLPETAPLRGRDLYDRVLQELDRNESLDHDEKFWDQSAWRRLHSTQIFAKAPLAWNPGRGRNGAKMCFGALACDLAGGRWLVEITDQGPAVDGQPVDLADFNLAHLDMLWAEPDDDPTYVITVYGHRVIDVEFRAHRLLQVKQLNPFYTPQDLNRMRTLRDEIYA